MKPAFTLPLRMVDDNESLYPEIVDDIGSVVCTARDSGFADSGSKRNFAALAAAANLLPRCEAFFAEYVEDESSCWCDDNIALAGREKCTYCKAAALLAELRGEGT